MRGTPRAPRVTQKRSRNAFVAKRDFEQEDAKAEKGTV
jgi:hypothetical protein